MNEYKNPHMVGKEEDPNGVLTVALLRHLLNSGTYPDEMIVMLDIAQLTSIRQATGFFTARDDNTGKPFLVITSGKDAQTEAYKTCDIPNQQ